MSTAPSPTAAPAYSDRSATLIVAGVFQILLGCFCGLMAAMMVFLILLGPLPQAAQGQVKPMPVTIQPVILYLLLAVAFVWMGIGLVRARRWAWTLTVVLSWMWLVIGVLAFVVVACLMRQETWAAIAQQGKMTPEMMTMVRIITTVTLVCIYILLPGMFLLLLHHEGVRATCFRRDPKIRWTDRCPMPVLVLSILLAFSLVSLSSLVSHRNVLPLFGVVLSGSAGAVAILLVAIVQGYLAWGTYRLQKTAWWGTLLWLIVGTVSMVVTFSRTDLMKMYEKMGIPADQTEMIRKMGMVEIMSQWGPWMGLAGGIVWLGYLLFLRRYFFHRGEGVTAIA
jgi:hypothetical protein